MQDEVAYKSGVGTLFFHCHKCKQKLRCLRNTLIVECPTCNAICNPYSEYVTVCIGCNRKLHYPPSAQIIQCTHKGCDQLMDITKTPAIQCAMTCNDQIIPSNSNQIQMTKNGSKSNEITPYRTAFEWFVTEHQNDIEYKYLSKQCKMAQMQCDWDMLNAMEQNKYITLSVDDRKKYFKALHEMASDNTDGTTSMTHDLSEDTVRDSAADSNHNRNRNEQPTEKKSASEPHEMDRLELTMFKYDCNKTVNDWNINDICHWLDGIGMKKYIEALKTQFIEDGIVGMDLSSITMMDLQDYGVRDSNHRRWILQNIRSLS